MSPRRILMRMPLLFKSKKYHRGLVRGFVSLFLVATASRTIIMALVVISQMVCLLILATGCPIALPVIQLEAIRGITSQPKPGKLQDARLRSPSNNISFQDPMAFLQHFEK